MPRVRTKNTTPVHVPIDPDTRAAVRYRATRQYVSMSSWVADAIRYQLDNPEPPGTECEPQPLAGSVLLWLELPAGLVAEVRQRATAIKAAVAPGLKSYAGVSAFVRRAVTRRLAGA